MVAATGGAVDYENMPLKELKILANKGGVYAQFLLGRMYYDGKGVPQDYTKALKWFRMAAVQGNAEAQFFLGTMYGSGKGVSQNYIKAYVWFNLSAAQGNEFAKKNIINLTTRMSSDQITEAQKEIEKFEGKNQGKNM